jgi:hypothetical protein
VTHFEISCNVCLRSSFITRPIVPKTETLVFKPTIQLSGSTACCQMLINFAFWPTSALPNVPITRTQASCVMVEHVLHHLVDYFSGPSKILIQYLYDFIWIFGIWQQNFPDSRACPVSQSIFSCEEKPQADVEVVFLIFLKTWEDHLQSP